MYKLLDKANKFPDSFYIVHEDFTQVTVLSVPFLTAVVETNFCYAQDIDYVLDFYSWSKLYAFPTDLFFYKLKSFCLQCVHRDSSDGMYRNT